MSRQPIGQLSLLIGRPDVLEVEECTIEGCTNRLGIRGPCIRHRIRPGPIRTNAPAVEPGRPSVSLAKEKPSTHES